MMQAAQTDPIRAKALQLLDLVSDDPVRDKPRRSGRGRIARTA